MTKKMVQVLIPMGSRVLVKDIDPVDTVSERARQAGIIPVVYEMNTPKPTTGLVVAVGPDPELQRQIKVGDVVFFSKHAGHHTVHNGETYRTIEYHEITNVQREVEVEEAPEPSQELH